MQALTSNRSGSGNVNLQHISADVQCHIIMAHGLVHKYGHEGTLDALLRFESKSDVEDKFDAVIEDLNKLAEKVTSKYV